MTDEELAAVIAAIRAAQPQDVPPPQTQPSAWKRAARREAAGVFDERSDVF